MAAGILAPALGTGANLRGQRKRYPRRLGILHRSFYQYVFELFGVHMYIHYQITPHSAKCFLFQFEYQVYIGRLHDRRIADQCHRPS